MFLHAMASRALPPHALPRPALPRLAYPRTFDNTLDMNPWATHAVGMTTKRAATPTKTTTETQFYIIHSVVTVLGYTIFLMINKNPFAHNSVAVCNQDGESRFFQSFDTSSKLQDAKDMANSMWHLFSVALAEEDLPKGEPHPCECEVDFNCGCGRYNGLTYIETRYQGADEDFEAWERAKGLN